jgi:hypothetical protein
MTTEECFLVSFVLNYHKNSMLTEKEISLIYNEITQKII